MGKDTASAESRQLFPPRPGLEIICRWCAHLDDEAANEGHVAPCDRVRWDGPQHLGPALEVVDGAVRCADREARS